jgi:PAS domain S-box-containing protein
MSDVHGLQSENLGVVLKTALDAVVVMRMDGTIAGWNHVAEQTFGWSFAEAEGKRMSEMIIPQRFRGAHEQGLAHFHATGEGPVLNRRIEIEALHRDGHELPIELSITHTGQFGEPIFLGFLRDISDRREAAHRQELLIGELNHRVKNLLGVVAGIAHMTSRSVSSLSEFRPAFSNRLAALGKAHEILTAATWQQASLRALAKDMLSLFIAGDTPRATISGPDILLRPRHLLSVSMILHELLTNASKYGALASPGGHISLQW